MPQLCIHSSADELSVCPCVRTISVHLLIQDAVITPQWWHVLRLQEGIFPGQFRFKRRSKYCILVLYMLLITFPKGQSLYSFLRQVVPKLSSPSEIPGPLPISTESKPLGAWTSALVFFKALLLGLILCI